MLVNKKSDRQWQEQLALLENGLVVLDDKPEETAQSSLKALWLAANNTPFSVEEAAKQPLCELDQAAGKRLAEMVERRLQGEPLSYITKRQSFMGVELLASPGAMIPRKETEILAVTALELIDKVASTDRPVRIIDICTGSGNLPVIFARHNPDAKIYAADLSCEAVALAKKNVARNDLEKNIEIRQGNLLEPFKQEKFFGSIDILTCNPPYISNAKLKDMPSEIIGHEPEMAFAAGMFGIDILNQLVHDAPEFLNRNGGCLCFEIGEGQGPFFIKRMEKKNIFKQIEGVEDENGQIRVVVARI